MMHATSNVCVLKPAPFSIRLFEIAMGKFAEEVSWMCGSLSICFAER